MTTAVETSKTRLAHQHLRQRIADGTYSPGFRLVLSQIANDLGVSVVPVREAIRMLEAEGLVTYVHNVGAQVSFPDPHLYRNTMETLGLVEGYATALSAPKITPEELERAAAINEEMRKLAAAASFDPTAFTDANHRFHDILHAHCDNDHISDLVRRGWGRLEAMRESSFGLVPNRAAESVAEHDQLVDLIRDGAPAAEIERAAREHRLRTMRAVLEQQGDANA